MVIAHEILECAYYHRLNIFHAVLVARASVAARVKEEALFVTLKFDLSDICCMRDVHSQAVETPQSHQTYPHHLKLPQLYLAEGLQ
jgi:hypothetical protein